MTEIGGKGVLRARAVEGTVMDSAGIRDVGAWMTQLSLNPPCRNMALWVPFGFFEEGLLP